MNDKELLEKINTTTEFICVSLFECFKENYKEQIEKAKSFKIVISYNRRDSIEFSELNDLDSVR